jgi:hypothetical protein
VLLCHPGACLQVLNDNRACLQVAELLCGDSNVRLALLASSFRSLYWLSVGAALLPELSTGAACRGCLPGSWVARFHMRTIACFAAGFNSCAAAVAQFGAGLRHGTRIAEQQQQGSGDCLRELPGVTPGGALTPVCDGAVRLLRLSFYFFLVTSGESLRMSSGA